jgi:3-hydroxyacyl-CoA dehydrogenase/enoyl-CoA hydratase/3-hydroxybutyryl-CoA epimerase
MNLMSTIPNIRNEVTPEGLCILTFDRAGSSANIFDRGTLQELVGHLDAIPSDGAVKGVVFFSAKPSIFIAGADLHALQSLRDDELERFIALGQEAFNKITALKVPTVAAIHGACVGGGYELCLACDYRVASTDRATKIGLPETQLGILPAWGGCTRLPRLIGVSRALDIILGGKTPGAKDALRKGLIDQVAPRELLLRAAAMLIRRGKRSRSASLTQSLSARLIAPMARRKMMERTRGHYPALERSLEVVTRGITTSIPNSLQLEREAVRDLARTDACRHQLGLFFQQERSKKRVIPDANREGLRKMQAAAVVGAGVMGYAIAHWLSARGLRVILRDIDPPRVAAGMANIAKLYASGVKRRALTKIEARDGFDRVVPAASEVPLRHVDVVIEAIVEKMDLKKRVFGALATQIGSDTLVATNTSALSITEMAETLPDPSRLVGIHFFNPVHRMQLVEIVLGEKTSPDTAQRAVSFVQQIGKLPVVVRDRPGFLVNRILLPYLIEAGHLFDRGASIQDIDEAMLDFGMPMGPLRLIDEVGIDVATDVAANLAEHFPNRLKVPAVMGKLIEAKMLGRKNGKGFYLHGRNTKVNPAAQRLRASHSSISLTREKLQQRMVLLMIAESARCLEEKVAESAADVDFAMVMGTGFAPFRGGPLRHADALGLPRIAEQMHRADIPVPALIEQLAADNRPFHED